MQIAKDTLQFKPYSSDKYTLEKNECPKCGSLMTVAPIDNCTRSLEAHCRCGKIVYLFYREVSNPFKKDRKYSGPSNIYTLPCMCHEVFGGPPCKVVFKSKAINAKYCKEHSKEAKAQLMRNTRAREIK